MPVFPNTTQQRLRADQIAIGFGVHHLRTVATAMLAKAVGWHWLFIDMEHGAFSMHEATQLCIAALPTGVTPIVRVCADALDEGTRALDNGAQGLVIPHVDTPAQARRIGEAFRFPPRGRRSWGGPVAVAYGFAPPAIVAAQQGLDGETLIAAMIETEEAVANAEAIAATPGIDVLMIGTNDLSAEMGIAGQFGDARIHQAYADVAAACRKHGKVLGSGGVNDEANVARYVGAGARFILGGTDQGFLLAGAAARAAFLNGLG